MIDTLSPSMRRLLVVAGVLVVLAGVQLFVFPERTAEYFAWTIDPPLTAAFLGAAYWASAVFEFRASRETHWSRARIAVPTVFVFTALTLLVTLVHLDRFHLDGEFALATRLVTWTWIAIYAVVPIVMAILWIRHPRANVPALEPGLPGSLRTLVGVQAAVLLAVGGYLLVAPESAASLWPWALTALTGRAVGAWLLSLGVAATHALVENQPDRLRPAAWAFVALGLLELAALARYPDSFDFASVSGAAFLLMLATTVVSGLWAIRLSN